MENELSKAIEVLKLELKKLSEKSADIKKTINHLYLLSGEAVFYTDVDVPDDSGSGAIRPDQFFGKSFVAAAKEFLRMKKRAATAEEIYSALKKGGYEFGKNVPMRGVAISLSKNRTDFVYVKSSNAYGLWEFYPGMKREKSGSKNIEKESINNPETQDSDNGNGD